MSDIVEKLKRIADAAGYTNGNDSPLGEQVRAGANEIERLRELLSDLLGCAESECVGGSSYEPIQAARAALKDYQS